MQPRTDGLPFEGEPVVDPDLCVSCGICAGACPTSTPFRRMSELIPGIDLPDRSMAAIRADVDAEAARITGGGRIMVFGCINAGVAARQRSESVGVVPVNCTGQLPPAFIDYVLSRNLADGVVIAGCSENSCYNRFGSTWTAERLAGRRDPYLRMRVPRERVKTLWVGRLGAVALSRSLADFAAELRKVGPVLRRHVPHRERTDA
jgi:coenzyme F420-reducing hydrogenase delta subunit